MNMRSSNGLKEYFVPSERLLSPATLVHAEGCLMSHKSQIVNSVMRTPSPQIVNWLQKAKMNNTLQWTIC